MVKDSLKTGVSFGLTSATITTLGLMVGLESGTKSEVAVLGGILTIAIADAFSDALGIHIAEEAKNGADKKHIWEATLSTFFFKFVFAMTFVVPVLLIRPLWDAILVSVAWGLFMLAIFSFGMAKAQNEKPFNVVAEHLLIAIIVVVLTHYVGDWIASVV
jgi:VIT1/CCC1 family predicted Fe2+/Mn2+ transporter